MCFQTMSCSKYLISIDGITILTIIGPPLYYGNGTHWCTVCVPKVATYHVCITTPSQSLCSLHIQHSCQEEYRYLAKFFYCYWILCISTSRWSCTHWWRQCYCCTWAHQLCMWDLASFGNRHTVEQDSRGDTGAISCTDTLHPSVKR